jgi:putative oxidoreductase
MSGITKLHDWNITLALFRNEYHVPVLPPAVAAVLGTGAELGLPVLLLLGCGTRITAAALFAFNIVAVISYPGLSPAGLKDHVLWGTLLLVLFFYGPGKLSVDHWLARKLGSTH